MELSEEKSITPENVIKILEKHGTKVTLEEAKIILLFMRKLAKMTVNEYLNS